MRRAGGLMDRIADRENLMLAFWKAQRGKRGKQEVLDFRRELETRISSLRNELIDGPLVPGEYRTFTIHDPKERTICAAPFRDRVLHHALMNVCHPVFESFQVHDSYACRIGKGTHRAVARAQEYARRHRYYLKMDVRKYFDSIDHDTLRSQLRRRFKDRRLLEILDAIIDSYHAAAGKGVPIGNLTSQYFANHYLGVLDHFVKEELRCRAFVRYMDDFVVWDDRRDRLKHWRGEITNLLRESLHLDVKPELLNRTTVGMTFLGYRVYPDRVTLARRSRVRFHRKLAQAHEKFTNGEWTEEETARHVEPLLAFVRFAQCDSMRRRVIERL